MNIHNCRICGLYIEESPWGDEENFPTYEICPCCGVEFGYEDYTVESAKKYRMKWISTGYKWFDPKLKPEDWNLEEQLKNIPTTFK